MEVKCVTAQIAALHPQHSRFRLGCLKLFPTLSPKRIQPQTPPRLPAFLLAAFSPEKDRIWSGEKKKEIRNKSLQILIFLLSSPPVIVWQDENFSSGCAGEQD